MAAVLTTVGLIILFALLALAVKRMVLPSLCPICLGVSLTWLTLTALMLSGLLLTTFYLLPTAVLIGGTVVGVVYQGEKKFKAMKGFTPKLVVLLGGFILAYLFLENLSWSTLAAATTILIPLAYLFFLRPPRIGTTGASSKAVEELEDKMEDCC